MEIPESAEVEEHRSIATAGKAEGQMIFQLLFKGIRCEGQFSHGRTSDRTCAVTIAGYRFRQYRRAADRLGGAPAPSPAL
jgi:hypothetical protein